MPDILHVDLDCFYVSVERRRDPSLEGRPVVVGGSAARGVVLSCSYEARAYGIRNGMPSMRAARMCPDVVFVRPDFKAYSDASKRFRTVLDAITPAVEPMSLDEAFCDVAGAHRLYGSTGAIAAKIRTDVRDVCGLVCSVGGGPSKLVAKIASRRAKPDGVLVVDDAIHFLHPLPVVELWGVGEATAASLHRLGIRTVGDLARTPKSVLQRAVGGAAGGHLHALANGVDGRGVETEMQPKSVGAEDTFAEDLDDRDRLHAELLRLSDRVASRLAAHDLKGRTVTVKIRLEGFETHTRSVTLPQPTADVWTIARTARDAFDGFRRGRRRVRLLGVSVSGLDDAGAPVQLSLDPGPRYAEAEEALVRVRDRFGSGAVQLARLVPPPPDDTDPR